VAAYDLTGKRVWVAGHRGMVGSALVRRLARENCEILVVERGQLDLCDQSAVRSWMEREKPHAVFVAAGKVGGIVANNILPADFLYENMMIEANIIHAGYQVGVEKLVFLGSSCIYPKFAPQPIPESALLTGALEPTNEWYAIAKIAGLKLCQAYRRQQGCDFISAMPANLYGPYDNFDLNSSHVVPALIRKVHEAKLAGADHIVLWGTGKPMRELLHVDDCADAVTFLMKHYSSGEHVNVGTGTDISINELARLTMRVIGFEGAVDHDTNKPDGTPRKVMDIGKLAAMGWTARISLEDGLRDTYQWFLDNTAKRADVRRAEPGLVRHRD
jgi:GDP-L-fucose synthase